MRKNVLFFAGCLCSLFAGAQQISKGTVVAHFNIGHIDHLNFRNSPSLKNFNVSFNPGVGYFINDNFEMGAGFVFNKVHINDHGSGFRENGTTVGIQLYTNYYFGKGKLKPYLTFQAGWNHSWGDFTFDGINNNYTRNYFHTSVGGGANWNISRSFSLFTEATYRKEEPFSRMGYSRLNLTVGARFFFGQKKKK
jgi:hypothetical protein